MTTLKIQQLQMSYLLSFSLHLVKPFHFAHVTYNSHLNLGAGLVWPASQDPAVSALHCTVPQYIFLCPMHASSKGQLISKFPFGVFKCTKKPTIFFSFFDSTSF